MQLYYDLYRKTTIQANKRNLKVAMSKFSKRI